MNLFRLFLSLMIAVYVSQSYAMHKRKVTLLPADRFELIELIELIVVSKDDRSPLTIAEEHDLNIYEGYTTCMVEDHRKQFARPPFLPHKKDGASSSKLLSDGIATIEKK
jgi:hypothetical protein